MIMLCKRSIEPSILSMAIFSVFFFVASTLYAGGITIPNTFAKGDILSAGTMNDNFTAIETAVNDNDARIAEVESTLSSMEIMRTISIPAWALSFTESIPVISRESGGIKWSYTGTDYATAVVRSPADYAGGDVRFYIFFRRTTNSEGTVNFLLTPFSLSSGDTITMIDPVPSTDVYVSGSFGALDVFQQAITIPADRLTNDWWLVSLERENTVATYSEDVYILSIAFEYAAAQ
jgi:hypothetical protein